MRCRWWRRDWVKANHESIPYGGCRLSLVCSCGKHETWAPCPDHEQPGHEPDVERMT